MYRAAKPIAHQQWRIAAVIRQIDPRSRCRREAILMVFAGQHTVGLLNFLLPGRSKPMIL
jgi:hypothetical protein